MVMPITNKKKGFLPFLSEKIDFKKYNIQHLIYTIK
jgi:hypothetical protein